MRGRPHARKGKLETDFVRGRPEELEQLPLEGEDKGFGGGQEEFGEDISKWMRLLSDIEGDVNHAKVQSKVSLKYDS